MKKVIIVPDSFKGTLSALEVCRIVKEALKESYPDCEITEIPMADGGEGTVDALLHFLGGEKIYCKVKSPLGNEITAYYGITPDGKAIIEMACASGITLEKENNPLLASTYGTGQLIHNAIEKGAKEIILGIGGSATTDAGIGCVSALGGKFLDETGDEVPLCGLGLGKIRDIDLSAVNLKGSKITVLCDVKNPLYGKKGAACVYAPQKGADENQVKILDEGLKNIARVTKEKLNVDFSGVEGAGAAGGLGFGAVSFLGARLISGIDCILSLSGFEEKAKTADLIITGEGKMDSQSLMGKVPFGVASKSGGTKVIALVGVNDCSEEETLKGGIAEVIETNPERLSFEHVKAHAEEMLRAAAKKITI